MVLHRQNASNARQRWEAFDYRETYPKRNKLRWKSDRRSGGSVLSDQPKPTTGEQVCENTDRELWREREGDYYADSIHVTKDGGIGINCGGHVFVKPLRSWHELAQPKPATGEWTAVDVAKAARRCLDLQFDERIAKAINAALAAERRAVEVRINEGVAVRDINHLNRIDELEQQLASEREKGLRRCPACGKEYKLAEIESLENTIQQLRSQLAAAESSYKSARQRWAHL